MLFAVYIICQTSARPNPRRSRCRALALKLRRTLKQIRPDWESVSAATETPDWETVPAATETPAAAEVGHCSRRMREAAEFDNGVDNQKPETPTFRAVAELDPTHWSG